MKPDESPTNTSNVAPSSEPLTIEALTRLVASREPEPIGEWMRSQGFPPEKCVLILPLEYRNRIPALRYVAFSPMATDPIMCWDLRPRPWTDDFQRPLI